MTRTPRPSDRLRLVAKPVDPAPVQPGQIGTVINISHHGCGRNAWRQIDVAWDNGRRLTLVSPPDESEIVNSEATSTS